MKTPTEICADRIRDLEAKLQMADERHFYLAAENARLRSALDGAEKCIVKALPFCPADKEAVFLGEWLGDIRAGLNTLTHERHDAAHAAAMEDAGYLGQNQ